MAKVWGVPITEIGEPHYDDPSLALLFSELKSKTLQTAKGTSEISGRTEFNFVLQMARVFCRMGKSLPIYWKYLLSAQEYSPRLSCVGPRHRAKLVIPSTFGCTKGRVRAPPSTHESYHNSVRPRACLQKTCLYNDRHGNRFRTPDTTCVPYNPRSKRSSSACLRFGGQS